MQKTIQTMLFFLMLMISASALCFASIAGSTATPEPDYYQAGIDQDIAFLIYNASTDAEWLDEIIITFPEDWVINSLTHYEGPNHSGSHDWLMEGEGTNIARWYNTSSYGVHYSNSDHYYAVNIFVPGETTGYQTVQVDIYGDEWGAPPHELSLEVMLYGLEEGIYINPHEVHTTVCSGDTIHKTLSVWNNAPFEMTVNLFDESHSDYSVSIYPESFSIPPHQTLDFTVTIITPSPNADQKDAQVIIFAEGWETPSKQETAFSGLSRKEVIYTAEAYFYITTLDDFCTSLVAPLQDPRLDGATVSYGGKLYVIGGYHSPTGDVISTEIYDPVTDTWTYGPPVPSFKGLEYPSSAASVDNKIVVQNGTSSTWVWLCVDTGDWHPFEAPVAESFGGKVISYDNMIYLVGGALISPSINVSNKLFSYHLSTNTWTQLPDMPVGAWWHEAFAADGKIYLIGGYHGTGANYDLSTNCYVFDLDTNEWTPIASMPAGRWGAAGAYNGSVFVLAGGSDGTSSRDEVFVYDPVNDSWTTAEAKLPVGTFRFGAAAIGKHVYTAGGWQEGASFFGIDAVQKIQDASFVYGPDAAIFPSDIIFDPPYATPGDPGTIEITTHIRNVGAASLNSGTMNIYYYLTPDDPYLISSSDFGAIQPGQMTTLMTEWDTTGLPESVYTVMVELVNIEPEDVNPNNNVAFRDFALPVELAFFSATGFDTDATIYWRTISEVDNLGWNLYRMSLNKTNDLMSSVPVKVNESLIPGQGTCSNPHSYSFTDQVRHGFDYIYVLESVSIYGETQQWEAKLQWKHVDPVSPAKPMPLELYEMIFTDR